MNLNRLHSPIRALLAMTAVAGLVVAFLAATPATAGGLRNCVDITGPQSGRAGCYELVWVDGVQHRMTFSNTGFDGATPRELDAFYVLAPQSAAAQGYPPNTFPHDHVVRDLPDAGHGAYSVRYQGYFVVCSGEGIATGACTPAWTSVGGPDPMPFAQSVHGEQLTSADAIEAAAAAGLVVPMNLGPGAVIVGTVSGR